MGVFDVVADGGAVCWGNDVDWDTGVVWGTELCGAAVCADVGAVCGGVEDGVPAGCWAGPSAAGFGGMDCVCPLGADSCAGWDLLEGGGLTAVAVTVAPCVKVVTTAGGRAAEVCAAVAPESTADCGLNLTWPSVDPACRVTGLFAGNSAVV